MLGVLAAIQAEQRAFQLVGDVERGLLAGSGWWRSSPGRTRRPPPSASGYARHTARCCVRRGRSRSRRSPWRCRRSSPPRPASHPGRHVHLVVRLLADDVADDLLDVGHLRKVGDARVDLGRDRHVAQLGEAAADVLDVFVDAEDLLVHQDDREVGALGRAWRNRRAGCRPSPGSAPRRHRGRRCRSGSPAPRPAGWPSVKPLIRLVITKPRRASG